MTQALAAVLAEFEGFFFRGPKTGYDAAVTHKDKLYFATDTGEILMNGKAYVGGGVKDVAIATGTGSLDGQTVLRLTMQDGTTKDLGIEAALLESGLLEYKNTISSEIAMVDGVGGIPAGTTAGDLAGKTFSELFEDLLFPTVNPTFVAPSAKLSLKSTTTTPTIQEVGTTGASVPTEASFNTSFDKGQIKIGSTKQADRAGALNAENSFIYINGDPSNKEFPTEIPEGSITYKYRAAYAQGPQPKDSKGNNYGSPRPAGTVDSGAVTVNGVYPYYGSTGADNALVKLALTTGTQVAFDAPAETADGRHGFKLPAKYNVTKVEWYNVLGDNWIVLPLTNFTASTANETVQGKQVSYKTYRRNEAALSGATQFKVTFTK